MDGSGHVGYIQAVGYDPRAATFADSYDFGIGAVLVAAVELHKIAEPAPFLVSAGAHQSLADFGGEGAVAVKVSGHVTFETPPAEPASYTWMLNDTVLGAGLELRVRLPVGVHTPRLVVEADGHTVQADTRVVVGPEPYLLAGRSAEQDGNPAVHVMDRSLDTRWSADGKGQWLLFDFGLPVQVHSLAASFYLGDARTARFRIETSLDGETWTAVGGEFSSSGATLQPETFDLPASPPLRYLRFIGEGNSVNTWNSVTTLSFARTLSRLDSRADGVPDGWLRLHLGDADWSAGDDPLDKGATLLTDYIAGMDPLDPQDRWEASLEVDAGDVWIRFPARGPDFTGVARKYSVYTSSDLKGDWSLLPGYADLDLPPGPASLPLPSSAGGVRFYRVVVRLEL